MIFFIGDEPSKDNVDPEVAFVGTKSYKRLLGWIADMNLSTNDIFIANKKDIYKYPNNKFYVETKSLHSNAYMADIVEGDKIVALGQKARKYIEDLGLECFYLPHPSGNNRMANPSKSLKDKLKACKKFINS
jgi:uracil-DNA glycosylase